MKKKWAKKWLALTLSGLLMLGTAGLSGSNVKQVEAAEGDVFITEFDFPDDTFRSYLSSEEFDVNQDGKLSIEERNNILGIYLSDSDVVTLKGIENFPELTELLCANTDVTEANLSKNTKLKYIDFGYSHLKKIDVSMCEELTSLWVQNNQLSSIDVSNNKKLTFLDISDNELTSVDVSNNTELVYLSIVDDHFTELDVRKNTKLRELEMNDNDISRIDLSCNTELEELLCLWNPLETLDLSKNTKLKTLFADWELIEKINVDGIENVTTVLGVDAEETEAGYRIDLGFIDGWKDRIVDDTFYYYVPESESFEPIVEKGSVVTLPIDFGYFMYRISDKKAIRVNLNVLQIIEGAPEVFYATQVQGIGWMNEVTKGEMSGTSGQSRRLETIKIRVESPFDLGIQYTTHCQNYGWLPWSANGEINGTVGESKRLEAIKIQLTGEDKYLFDVYYRVHAQSYGWLGWAKNGEMAGTAGLSKRLEGIQIVILHKGETPGDYQGIQSVREEAQVVGNGASKNPTVAGVDSSNVAVRTHVQSIGWQGWKYNGTMAGTSGQSKRLEGIEIKLTNQQYSGDIVYRTHVQRYGWMAWKKNGEMAGTSGESKRLEAIQIKLEGDMARHYDIYYRVHAQRFGWLGWAKNGEMAGTSGYSYRLESIQVVLVPKGKMGPGNKFAGITGNPNIGAYETK